MTLKLPTILFGAGYDLVRQAGEIRRNMMQSDGLHSGRLLTGLKVTTSAKDFEHGLGRKLSGWIIADIDSNAVVWSPSGGDRATTLRLQGSANCTVSVWVF